MPPGASRQRQLIGDFICHAFFLTAGAEATLAMIFDVDYATEEAHTASIDIERAASSGSRRAPVAEGRHLTPFVTSSLPLKRY